MMPLLFSIGSFHVFSFSIFLIIAWFVWSFLFWRHLRSLAINEEQIFDAMFITTLVSLAASRLGFVVSHLGLFASNWLRVIALWVQPGLSFYAGLIGAILTILLFALKRKIRVAHMLDAFSLSFMWAYTIGSVGGFLDGSVFGKTTNVAWAIPYVGQMGLRHPVQIYQIILMLVVIGVVSLISTIAKKRPWWPAGSIAMWFFALFSFSAFAVEFFIEHTVYWGHLSANQWVLVGIIGQSLGAFYIRGGGKERLIIVGRASVIFCKKCIGGIYAKFSKRNS